MAHPGANDPELSSSGHLEDLVAGALEALDRGGDAALKAFLAAHPAERAEVEALVSRFRHTGLLARDAHGDLPERLGDFRLVERLGGGGMGVVFVAEQESLRRRVALKVIRPDLLFFAGTRERFRREVEVVAKMSHPAIVPIVATGDDGRVPWYAMPLIDGASVDEAVRRLSGRDPATLAGADLQRAIAKDLTGTGGGAAETFAGAHWEAAVRLVRQAAMGLAHAHHRGIVHRDVKPSNVMLTPDGRALLLDFGLCLVQGDPRLTHAGGEPGSPAYMAPEQVRGSGADERADVYSLAATLRQLLDLEAPFSGPDQEQLRARILRGESAPPRNRAVPRELRLVLAVAMDLDRERRYADAEAFAADLGAVLARRPIAARRLPARIRTWRWAQRHRVASAVLAGLAVVAALLPAGLAWQQQRVLADLERAKVRAEASRDQALRAVTDFLVRFGESDLIALPSGQAIAAGLLDRAVASLDAMRAENDAPVLRQVRLHAERAMVTALRLTGRIGEARERAQRVLSEWSDRAAITPEIALMLASVRGTLLSLTGTTGDAGAAAAIDRDARADLEIAERDPGLRSRARGMLADLVSWRGVLCSARGDLDGAERALRESIGILEAEQELPADLVDNLCLLRNRLADGLWMKDRLDEAEGLFLRTERDLTPAEDPTAGRPANLRLWGYAAWGLARIAYSRGDNELALRRYTTAAGRYEASAYAYPDDVGVVGTFAAVLTEQAQLLPIVQKDPAAGIALHERARALFRRCARGGGGEDDSAQNRQRNLRCLGEVQLQRGALAEAADVAREIVATTKEPERLANAGWQLLVVAGRAAESGRGELAAECDREALGALVACDAAGWFPPVNLDDAPCRRLAAEPKFRELRQKHPPEQASRTRPKRQ